MVPSDGVSIDRQRPTVGADLALELECPYQLGDGHEHVSFGQVHSRTDATPCAVAVVIPFLPVTTSDILRCQKRVVLVPVWIELLWVLPYLRVHVHAPDIEDDRRALRKELAVYPIVCYRFVVS